jgi:hypothetical protein
MTSVLAILVSPNEKKESEVFDDYIDYIRLNASDRPRFSPINIESHVAGKLNIEPVVDLLNSNKKSVVWGSLENLSHRSDSLAVSLIKQTIQRSDMDIKYLSSLGLDRIESIYSNKLAIKRIAIKQHPSITNYTKLFELVLQYINSGLLDKELSENLINETLASISHADDQYPGNPTISAYKASFLLNLKKTEEARNIFKDLMDKNLLADKFKIQACEVFFQSSELEILETLVKDLTKNEFNQNYIEKVQFETELSDLREFWLKEEKI